LSKKLYLLYSTGLALSKLVLELEIRGWKPD